MRDSLLAIYTVIGGVSWACPLWLQAGLRVSKTRFTYPAGRTGLGLWAVAPRKVSTIPEMSSEAELRGLRGMEATHFPVPLLGRRAALHSAA